MYNIWKYFEKEQVIAEKTARIGCTGVTLFYITLLDIATQWISDSAHLRAFKYSHICTFFSFSCKALFSDFFFSIYIFSSVLVYILTLDYIIVLRTIQ